MSEFRQRAIEDVARAMGRSPGRLSYAVKNGGLGVKAKELAYAVAQRERVLELEAKSAPKEPQLYEEGRCQMCGWVLSKRVEDGCVSGNCGSRPREGSEEWFRLKERRQWLRENHPKYLRPARKAEATHEA